GWRRKTASTASRWAPTASRRSSRDACRGKHRSPQPANARLAFAAVARSWAELLGDAEGAEETDADQAGFFSRLRDSLGKSRRALTEQIAAATFDPADEAAWERLEEALIAADVGVPSTAELVRRLEARGGLGDHNEALAEEAAALLGEPGRLGLDGPPGAIPVVGANGTGQTAA